MRKGHLIMLLAVVGVLVGGFFVFYAREEGPRFGGRSLSQWVVLCQYGNTYRDPLDDSDIPTEREAAADAIRHIGTNSVPWLLKWIRYEQPAWEERIEDFRNRRSLTWIPVDRAELRAYSAVEAFKILGSEAEMAIPQLIAVLNRPVVTKSSYRAAGALGSLGPQVAPNILTVLTNDQPSVRRMVIRCLGSMGTNALPAIPSMIQCLEDTNVLMSSIAADQLGKLKLKPEIVVPSLTSWIQRRGDESDLVETGIGALGEFGQHARPAVSGLVKFLDDDRLSIRQAATNAVLQIAPEILKNPKPR